MKKELMNDLIDYFNNTPKGQILKDMVEAAGGEEKFNEIFEDIE